MDIRDTFPDRIPGPRSLRGAQPELSQQDNQEGFIDTLKSFIREANDLQGIAADRVESLVAGETNDIHDVMIAMEKASVSFNMVMEIRNKMLEAYQELMRTQI